MAKRIILTAMAAIGYAFALPLLRRWRGRNRPQLLVLRYHSVSDIRCHETNVTPTDFARQIRWLKRRYRMAAPEDVGTWDGQKVLVTFDDGYADNIHQALPILRREGVKPLIFLVAGYVGTEKILPHDAADNPQANLLLRWEEVRASDPCWVEFGSHGWSHYRLSGIGETAGLAREINLSKQTIEQESGRPVRFLSYPFGVQGDYDTATLQAARQAGYRACFNAKYGVNFPGGEPFDLFRIGVERSDTLFTLGAKLNGALDMLFLAERSWARSFIRTANRLLGV